MIKLRISKTFVYVLIMFKIFENTLKSDRDLRSGRRFESRR
jgi:hypothetical protein